MACVWGDSGGPVKVGVYLALGLGVAHEVLLLGCRGFRVQGFV